MLLETDGFETNLARWKIHGDPPADRFVVGALFNSTLDTINGKRAHRGGTPCPIEVNAKICHSEEPKSRRRDTVLERPALWHPFQDVIDIEFQFSGTILSFCQAQRVHVIIVPGQ
jgi:hypothetical protein